MWIPAHRPWAPGISHASFQQKNHMRAYEILLSFFTRPEPVYKGH